MKKSYDSENKPWEKGLHDAVILSISEQSTEPDWSQRDPIRSVISIALDASGAMFDTRVKELRFINAKAGSDAFDGRGWWWVDDSVTRNGKKLTVTIELRSPRDRRKLTIECDDIEVIRS